MQPKGEKTVSRFSEKFIAALDSDFYIDTRETRKPTEEELSELDAKYEEVHKIRDEINRLQDVMQQKRREAETFANRIYGLKTFKVKKPRKR